MLTFIKELPPIKRKSNNRRGLFLCDCGNTKEVVLHEARYGHTSSCGCYHIKRIRDPKTHGETCGRNNSPEYRSWKAIKGRCYDKNNIGYENYGGRGISVCERWLHDFATFLEDMGRKPSSKHSIDRINNDGNYEPSNCRWATMSEQRRNNRIGVHNLTIDGITMPIRDWASKSGVPEESISSRVRNGWDIKEAVFKPIMRPRKTNAEGQAAHGSIS